MGISLNLPLTQAEAHQHKNHYINLIPLKKKSINKNYHDGQTYKLPLQTLAEDANIPQQFITVGNGSTIMVAVQVVVEDGFEVAVKLAVRDTLQQE